MDEKTFKTSETNLSTDVLEFYDRYAVTWDERFGSKRSTSAFHHVRLESFLHLAKLQKTDLIVELGVGTGPYLDMLSPLVNRIVGIDGSEKMLDVLLSKYKSLENIEVLRLDLEHPIDAQLFQADVLYCFGLVEHIIDTKSFLENCRRFLKIGGRFVVITTNGRSPWYGVLRRFFRAGRHCSSDKYYTEESLDSLMRSYGFLPEQKNYWGYFPAGVGDGLFILLNGIGKMLDKTWLRRYAGGLTASYILEADATTK